jgi:hypothetical protein
MKKRDKLIRKIKEAGLEKDFKRWHSGIALDDTAGWIIDTYSRLYLKEKENV